MKTNYSERKTVPVPGRGKELHGGKNLRRRKNEWHDAGRRKICRITAAIIFTTGTLGIGSIAIAAGAALAPDTDEMPVVLANGEIITPPYYITVDDRKVALVESEEAAEEAMQCVIDQYRGNSHQVLDIEIQEDTGIEAMELKHGDEPPDILTPEEAKETLIGGNSGESYLTVIITEEKTEKESIGFTEEYKPDPELYTGESRVETEGREGTLEVTKKITSENGETVVEEIIEEEILEEPVQQVVLTGTRVYDGHGGADGSYGDDNVSHDEDATYEMLELPVRDFHVSSPFGPRWGTLHTGIDMALAQGNPIHAADAGTVYFSGWGGGYGNLVKVDHGNGMQTYYAHCSQLLVSEGQHVERGQQIAIVGSTGNSTGPHVHFEVIINGNCIDPAELLPLE